MSETVRSYTEGTRPLFRGGRGRGARGTLRRRLFVAMAVMAVAYVYWIGRDTDPVHTFVSADRNVQILLSDIVNHRHEIASSRIWGSLPESHPLRKVPDFFGQDAPMPEWMLRNLAGKVGHFSRDHMGGPTEDILVVTRMTRVGCLLTRFQWLVPGIKLDRAGGLDVRRAGDDLFYAVRGRTLILSPSRGTLIHALTLSQNDHKDAAALEQELIDAADGDVSGTILFDAKGRAGAWVDGIQFVATFGEAEADVRMRVTIRAEGNEALSELLAKTRPVRLAAPEPGAIGVSLDMGVPLKELWSTVGDAFDVEFFSEDKWTDWETESPDDSLPGALTKLLGPAGPGVRITWLGIDEDEIFPVPEVVVLLDANEEDVREVLDSLPEPTLGPALHEARAYYDKDKDLLFAPTVSGPSLETAAAWYGDSLMISPSRTIAQKFLAARHGPPIYIEGENNVYVSLTPRRCVAEIEDAVVLLAENGLLKGHTSLSIDKQIPLWRKQASAVDRLVLLARVRDGAVEAELRVTYPDEPQGD